MKKSSVITGLICIASLALPVSVFAEENEEEAAPPALAEVWIIVPKTGMEAQFSEALAADKALRAKVGDSRSWQVYTVAFGDHFNSVQFRANFSNWGDQDAYEVEEEEKGFGASWDENVHQYVDHYHRHLESIDWENSHWPEGGGDGPYYGVTTWIGKQGAGPASEAARKEISQIALNEGWASDENNWLWLNRETGKDITMIVSSFASYADMEPPEQSIFEFLTETKGAEKAAALFSDFGSGFSDSDYTIWVHNPELSADTEEE